VKIPFVPKKIAANLRDVVFAAWQLTKTHVTLSIFLESAAIILP
jgi:hypothetical protein